jgi:predicted RNase H-like HicB family nuclease
MKYKVVLKRSDEGFAVSCPGLPGCWSEGQTESEALANIRDAISEYLAVRDGLLRDGDVREVEVASGACPSSPESIIGTPSGPGACTWDCERPDSAARWRWCRTTTRSTWPARTAASPSRSTSSPT